MGFWQDCVKPGGCLFRIYQILTYFPVLIVIAAVTWGYYAYVVQLCFLTVENIWQRILYLFFFHIFLLLFLTSYFQTIVSRPQRPPVQFMLDNEAEMELAACDDEDFRKRNAILKKFITRRDLPIRTKGYDGIRYCEKCKIIKPDRSHHCSMCSQCILKFDHHCPWVNNCVNFHNYKYFLLFLGYGTVFCLFVLFTDLPFFIDFWRFDIKQGLEMNKGKFHLLFLIFVSMLFAISLFGLFAYHLWLTSKNRTTVESFRAPILESGPDRNAFDHGVKANYREVFGHNPWLWFFPVFSSEGDGTTYRTRRSSAFTYRVSIDGDNGHYSLQTTDETRTTHTETSPFGRSSSLSDVSPLEGATSTTSHQESHEMHHISNGRTPATISTFTDASEMA